MRTAEHLIMFDIDGTLVDSYDFDSICFVDAVRDVLGVRINSDWSTYQHVTDSGILNQIMDEYSVGHDKKATALLVKEKFLSRINNYLIREGVKAVAGAKELLVELSARDDIALVFATGGWLESAKMKLDAAGIHFPDIPIASACDHYSRLDIMKLAEVKSGGGKYKSITYFGDGPWDLNASADLGYNFVLVGNRIGYHQSIPDFKDIDLALSYIGLQQAK